MRSTGPSRSARRRRVFGSSVLVAGALIACAAAVLLARPHHDAGEAGPPRAGGLPDNAAPRQLVDPSGFTTVMQVLPAWEKSATLADVAAGLDRIGHRLIDLLELDAPPSGGRPGDDWVRGRLLMASLLNYEGDVAGAEAVLAALRAAVEPDEALARAWLATIAYVQGVTSLRRGENENCLSCLGASACILPIAPDAVHEAQEGSRAAVARFTEILEAEVRAGMPDDLEVRWLLNIAHMTLGEWPDKVDPRFLLPLGKFFAGEPGMPRFEDVSARVGLDRRNEAGGAILEDLDGDGLLDAVLSTYEPSESLAVYRNRGDGTFEERTEAAGVKDQIGALNCVQTDFDNDGHADIFIVRGAWLPHPIRPSLLRNRGDATFEDVTAAAGLAEPLNSNSAAWADFDNDGLLDVFVCCERQPNRLYRNRGDGTFTDVAARAGVAGNDRMVKGAAWIDYDNDDLPDLFVNILDGRPRLYRNQGSGRFFEVTRPMGIDGPRHGFSCWAFDADNDGWLDIFATCYERSTSEYVRGLVGEPHGLDRCRLFRNLEGRGFRDVAREAGLDGVYATMGSNFGDLDGDGFLDIYLATGEPSLASLVPNRLFRNVGGKRFADVTSPSGTGHLQKGHGVSCGDWDRDGDLDMLVELGGSVPGDRYHTVLFQNPGAGNAWVTLKLVGTRTNRAAIGARIKVVTRGAEPMTIHRHVSTGSSFGANPLEQTIGLGRADGIATLEIRWPTSGTTQVFRDVPIGTRIEITELADSWRPAPAPRIDLPR